MQTASGFYFDTINSITADCSSALLRSCMGKNAVFESLLSRTMPQSDIWRINHASGAAVQVSEDTYRILKVARQIYMDSDRAFNIAVGSLVELWAFKAEVPRVPGGEQIQRAMEFCDFGQMRLENGCVQVPPGMILDLGGIAKGYIADQIAAYLHSNGVTSALLNYGGNIVAVGPKPDGTPWKIGLQSPGGVWGSDYWATTDMEKGTIVTSGIFERGFTINNRRYHHILDPRTGCPAENDVVSVTVRGENSMVADALATAMLIMGPEKGTALAATYGYSCVFVLQNEKVLYSPNFGLSVPAACGAPEKAN